MKSIAMAQKVLINDEDHIVPIFRVELPEWGYLAGIYEGKKDSAEEEHWKKEKAAFEGKGPDLIVTPIQSIDQVDEDSFASEDPFGDEKDDRF